MVLKAACTCCIFYVNSMKCACRVNLSRCAWCGGKIAKLVLLTKLFIEILPRVAFYFLLYVLL